MKKLYCMNCGTEIKGGIPNECSCGAEFDLADTKNIKRIITSIIFFVILMSPLLILIHFGRQYLQASIILYALLLILGIFLVSYRTNYFSSSWVSNYDEH